MFFTGKNPLVVAKVVVPSSSGSLLTISLMYAAEFALIRLAGIDVVGSDPAGQPPLATVMHTGCGTPFGLAAVAGVTRSKRPATMPFVGSVGLNVLYPITLRHSCE